MSTKPTNMLIDYANCLPGGGPNPLTDEERRKLEEVSACSRKTVMDILLSLEGLGRVMVSAMDNEQCDEEDLKSTAMLIADVAGIASGFLEVYEACVYRLHEEKHGAPGRSATQ